MQGPHELTTAARALGLAAFLLLVVGVTTPEASAQDTPIINVEVTRSDEPAECPPVAPLTPSEVAELASFGSMLISPPVNRRSGDITSNLQQEVQENADAARRLLDEADLQVDAERIRAAWPEGWSARDLQEEARREAELALGMTLDEAGAIDQVVELAMNNWASARQRASDFLDGVERHPDRFQSRWQRFGVTVGTLTVHTIRQAVTGRQVVVDVTERATDWGSCVARIRMDIREL